MLKRLLFAVLMALAFAAEATVYSSPWGPKPQFVDANGAPMVSGTITTYLAGSSTLQVTYTDSTGGSSNPTTITLNSRGETPNELWLTGGISYKFVLKDSAGATVWTVDNISGVNDTSASFDQWVAGPAPTYVSATSFTLAGDQTSAFHVGRRLKTTNSGGTVYSRISASSFGASTTVTVVNDSGSLDSGLSAVWYGLLSSTNPSGPVRRDDTWRLSDDSDPTKLLALQLSGITTATTRTWTLPDSSDTFVGKATTDTLTNKTLTAPTFTGAVTEAPRAAAYQWTTWNPSSSGTVTSAPSTAVATSTATNYISMANASGTVTFTFTKAGNYLVTVNVGIAKAAANTAARAYILLGGTATILGDTSNDQAGNDVSGEHLWHTRTFLVVATASQTLTVLPRITVTSGSAMSNFTGNANAVAIYTGT